MGLATDLGYAHKEPNPIQRAMQWFGSTKLGAKLFSMTLRHMDRFVHRISGGRATMPQILAGLPVLFVTTTGRKSGQPRTSPLIAVPVGETLSLVGTNFGQATTPAWVLNLEADPHADVRYRDVRLTVAARPATDEERASVWSTASTVYPGYDTYQQRIAGRAVRIFVLEPSP